MFHLRRRQTLEISFDIFRMFCGRRRMHMHSLRGLGNRSAVSQNCRCDFAHIRKTLRDTHKSALCRWIISRCSTRQTQGRKPLPSFVSSMADEILIVHLWNRKTQEQVCKANTALHTCSCVQPLFHRIRRSKEARCILSCNREGECTRCVGSEHGVRVVDHETPVRCHVPAER